MKSWLGNPPQRGVWWRERSRRTKFRPWKKNSARALKAQKASRAVKSHRGRRVGWRGAAASAAGGAVGKGVLMAIP